MSESYGWPVAAHSERNNRDSLSRPERSLSTWFISMQTPDTLGRPVDRDEEDRNGAVQSGSSRRLTSPESRVADGGLSTTLPREPQLTAYNNPIIVSDASARIACEPDIIEDDSRLLHTDHHDGLGNSPHPVRSLSPPPVLGTDSPQTQGSTDTEAVLVKHEDQESPHAIQDFEELVTEATDSQDSRDELDELEVGVAIICIEVLSIRPKRGGVKYGPDGEGSRISSKPGQEDVTDTSDQTPEASGNDAADSTNTAIRTRSAGQEASGGGLKRPGQSSGEDEDLQANPKRSKAGSKDESSPPGRRRLACPYQAYETWQRCGERKCGFTGISRLKQHLKRNHVRTSRCQRCWSHFETHARRDAHSQQNDCQEHPEAEYERFMDLQQESNINQPSISAGCEETTWWNMFQILMPNLRDIDRETLKTRYSPYYVYSGRGITIPPLVLPNVTFQAQQPQRDQNIGLLSQNSQHATEFPPVPRVEGSYRSEPLEVPVYVNPANLEFSQSFSLIAPNHSTDAAEQSQNVPDTGSFGMDLGESIDDWLDAEATNTSTGSSEPSTNQLTGSTDAQTSKPSPNQFQRVYDRQQSRYTRLEKVIADLRETNRVNRVDIQAVLAILDAVAADCNLPDLVSERLSSACNLLEKVDERLIRN